MGLHLRSGKTNQPPKIMAATDLSIIVPVYNEAENVRPLVSALEANLDGLDWEVLFVDDDSPDGTAAVVEALARENGKVRLILRVRDRGLSKSCIQGMLSSTADHLCVIDGDGQHDPAVIPKLIAPLDAGQADIVSAARDLVAPEGPGGLSSWRRRLSRLGNMLCRLAIHRDVRDPLTGLFAIRRAAFVDEVRRLSDSGFKLLFDILASNPDLRHVEVPFSFGERRAGESKLDFANIWQFGILLIEKLTRGIVPARLLSFLLIGGSGFAVHMAVLLPMLAAGTRFTVAQSLAAVIAMTNNFLLNNQLTFRDRRLSGLHQLLGGWLLFLMVSSVGLAANVAVASFTFERLQGFAVLAACAGIAMDTIWKFVISARFVWHVGLRRRR